jgi:(S)-mandelate dehydrogenase
MTPRILLDGVRHPVWSLRQVRQGFPQLAHFVAAGDGDVEAQAALMARQMDASFDWAALARLRDDWRGTLIVKGIVSAEDARHCERLGWMVSSSQSWRPPAGGRARPHRPSPAVADACGLPVLMDSGVRDGADG